MNVITYTLAQSYLAQTIEQTYDNHTPVIGRAKKSVLGGNDFSRRLAGPRRNNLPFTQPEECPPPPGSRRGDRIRRRHEAGVERVKLIFSTHAWEDYLYWQCADRKLPQRINTLIKETQRAPFESVNPNL